MQCFGAERKAAVCRELTKRFEEVTRGSLTDVLAAYADREVKGEIVLLIDRGDAVAADASTVEAALVSAMETMSVKDAAATVAQAFGLPRREVYQQALARMGSGKVKT